jgi:serine/threonine-protein kinase
VEPHRVIGRYALFDAIAAGGMATVYYGRLIGAVGFTRTVAIKQLHPRFSRDPDFVSMFIDEARVTAHIRHPNVVPVLDVVKHDRELYIVMEYVLGVSLAWLLRTARDRGDRVPIDVVSGIVCDCLEGLHAAHETRDERGERRGIIHRDVSPGNIMVGRDGIARVLDFGIAKAVGRAQVTRTGEVKGKPSYMAPEQLRGGHVTRATDIHAVAVTTWEALVGTRAFSGPPMDVVRQRQRGGSIPPASELDPELERFDPLLARGLAFDPEDRWPTARAMADALRDLQPPANAEAIAAWVEREAETMLDQRGRRAAALESGVSPTEIRAAIQADWNAETPMFNPSPRAASGADERGTTDDAGDLPSSRDAITISERDLVRDQTPTRVDPPSAALGPRTPAGSAHETLPDSADGPASDEPTAEMPDSATPPLPIEAAEVGEADDETATVPRSSTVGDEGQDSATWPSGGTSPPWQHETTPLAGRRSTRRSPAMGTLVVAAIAVALIAAVLVLARGPATTEEPTGAREPATAPEPESTASSPPELNVTAAAAAPTPPATVQASKTAAAHHGTTKPSTANRPRSKPKPTTEAASSGTDDPFDKLGGRH